MCWLEFTADYIMTSCKQGMCHRPQLAARGHVLTLYRPHPYLEQAYRRVCCGGAGRYNPVSVVERLCFVPSGPGVEVLGRGIACAARRSVPAQTACFLSYRLVPRRIEVFALCVYRRFLVIMCPVRGQTRSIPPQHCSEDVRRSNRPMDLLKLVTSSEI